MTSYVKQTWQDNNGAFPVSAARMQHIEDGLALCLRPDGDVLIGPNTGLDTSAGHSDNAAAPVDFWWDTLHRRLHLRTLLLSETGDTPEIALRRVDGTYPDGPTAAVLDNVALGLIHWTGAESPSKTFQHRAGQIYMRAAGDVTTTNAGGHMYFGTTTQGTVASPIDRLTIRQSGAVLIVSGNLSEAQGDALGGRGDLIVGGKVYATGRLVAVTGLGVGNTAAASTPGTVVKKMQVFDETGSSLGYVPIYNAIT